MNQSADSKPKNQVNEHVGSAVTTPPFKGSRVTQPSPSFKGGGSTARNRQPFCKFCRAKDHLPSECDKYKITTIGKLVVRNSKFVVIVSVKVIPLNPASHPPNALIVKESTTLSFVLIRKS